MMILRAHIKLFLLALGCLALPGSCSETPLGEPEAMALMAFDATDAPRAEPADVAQAAARAASDGTFGTGDSIGVFAYYLPAGKEMAAATPDFMYNQPIVRTAEGWTYSPVKYWPSAGSLSFFAYYPQNDPSIVLSENTAAGYPVLSYSTSKGDVDLLASAPLLNQTRETGNGTVEFVMHHALTKVAVYVKSTDDVVEKQVTAFSIKAVKSGTLTYHAPADAQDKGFGWTFPSSVTWGTFAAAVTDFSVPASSTADRQLLCTFYLLPRGVQNTFSITYTYTGANGLETIALKDLPLPDGDKWQPGAFLGYTIGIDNKVGVVVTADSHPSWSNGSSETVEGNIEK